jgi:hypothetical protein
MSNDSPLLIDHHDNDVVLAALDCPQQLNARGDPMRTREGAPAFREKRPPRIQGQ